MLAKTNFTATYVSQDGKVELEQVNDSIWRTTFTNNSGFVFDTTMVEILETRRAFYTQPNELHFLKFNWGGLSISESRIFVVEMSSYGMLGACAQMWGVYTNPFYKVGQEIVFEGNITNGKAGVAIDDVYLKGIEKPTDDYVRVIGKISKEPYPRSFYSTTDSPQGMFSDTTIVHYRLVMENPKIETIEKTIYKGYPVNTSSNQAAIAWEFADSEAYTLEGHELWTTEELQNTISVEGVLVQNAYGSFLKNWRIITD